MTGTGLNMEGFLLSFSHRLPNTPQVLTVFLLKLHTFSSSIPSESAKTFHVTKIMHAMRLSRRIWHSAEGVLCYVYSAAGGHMEKMTFLGRRSTGGRHDGNGRKKRR